MQKTAYDMRISDWSSDVCSSYLYGRFIGILQDRIAARHVAINGGIANRHFALIACGQQHMPKFVAKSHQRHAPDAGLKILLGKVRAMIAEGGGRSEEHTSELQSLMRSSYAVFCLKKKNNTNTPVVNI